MQVFERICLVKYIFILYRVFQGVRIWQPDNSKIKKGLADVDGQKQDKNIKKGISGAPDRDSLFCCPCYTAKGDAAMDKRDIERFKTLGIKAKEIPIVDLKVTEDANGKFYLTGYANTKDIPDSYGDIPHSLDGKPVYILDRMKSNPACFVDHYSSASNIAGNFVALKEDDKGLFFKLLLRSLEKIFNPLTKDAVSSYMESFGHALSIGGQWFFEDPDNPNHLTKAVIYEISLVGVGADRNALTDADYPKHIKSVVPFGSLPLADRDRPWSASKAKKRVQEWAGGEDGLDTATIQKKYKRAFFWWDAEKPETLKSYKLPFADIIDGALTAIPRGIFAAAGAISGARGGVDIPDNEKDVVITNIKKYYKKMDLDDPFESSASFRIDDISVLSARDIENLFRSGVSVSKTTAISIASLISSLLRRDSDSKDRRDSDYDWGSMIDGFNNLKKKMEV